MKSLSSQIIKASVVFGLVILSLVGTRVSAQDGGYNLTSQLWAKAVLQVSGAPVTLVWEMVACDITPSGAQVVSGYFYADPDGFVAGSQYNPEVFVKVYTDPSGWANMAFNHVADHDIAIYSAHQYDGTPDQSGSATSTNRLLEHSYTGISIDNTLVSPVLAPSVKNVNGYDLTSEFWAKAVLQVATTPVIPVNLIWKQVGTDTTPSGDQVVCGFFYADPEDFAYGSQYNPEAFVKLRVKSDGSAELFFNHVTVDPISIYSAKDYTGVADNTSSITLQGRLSIHQYGESGTVLASISITGPDSVQENGSASYTVAATYSDGTSETILTGVDWSVASSYASIGTDGTLTALAVESDQAATLSAQYGGKSATKTITILNQEQVARDGGYNVTDQLWAKAVLQVATDPVTPVTLIWKEVGADTTPSGDRVISGYFYADPADFAYGSPYNPEVFVKIYIATSGWCNLAFNHVTVDPVTISSAHNYSGAADQAGSVSTVTRLLEHQYSGLSTGF